MEWRVNTREEATRHVWGSMSRIYPIITIAKNLAIKTLSRMCSHNEPNYSQKVNALTTPEPELDVGMSPLLPASKLHSKSNEQPLLSTKSSNGGATVSGAEFNVTTSIIGAGIMSIPATVKVLGVIPALAIIIVVATLADISVEFLMRFTYHSSDATTTYAGIMRDSFWPIGALAVQISVCFTNLGCLIINLIIIGKRMMNERNVDFSLTKSN